MTQVEAMAKKKSPPPAQNNASSPKVPKQRGRPKRGGRITFRYAVAATPEYQAWMNEYKKFIGKADVTDVIRESVRAQAILNGFRPPPIM